MFAIIPIWDYPWLEFIDTIHPVNQPEAIEALNVIQSRRIRLKEQDLAFNVFTINSLDGCAGRSHEWRSDNAYHMCRNL
jgi:hypothetical protein